MLSEKTDNSRLPTSIVAIGVGNRMRTYLHYLEEHPQEARLVAVVECNELRRNNIADQFNIPQENRFSDYEAFFSTPVPADAVFICTPDDQHFRPCLMAIQHGYNVLLEKPIAQTYEECLALDKAAHDHNVIVCICHVMRYYPCYIRIKEIVDRKELGEVISIHHTERVGLDRFTHSYVRGKWKKKSESNDMFTAKCCHDVDFLLWMLGPDVHCKAVTSFGSLRWFRSENAPQNSARRCIDCSIEKDCPFSAKDLYWRRKDWIRNIDVYAGETQDDAIMRELKTGDIGLCVYHCNNDVVDHQSVLVEMQNGVTINIDMECATVKDYRNLHIIFSNGELTCDEKTIHIIRFNGRKEQVIDFSNTLSDKYHAGADLRIVEEFLHFLCHNKNHLTSLLHSSLPGHQLCFAAEESRMTGKTIFLEP